MRHVDNTPYLIISAELGHLDAERNLDRSLQLETLLESAGISYKKLAGKYNGQTERSYIVPFSAGVVKLAQLLAQESILKLYPDNKAELIYLETGKVETIGTLVPISRAEAMLVNSWSYRPDLNQFYTVK